jgi:hypothetical protein
MGIKGNSELLSGPYEQQHLWQQKQQQQQQRWQQQQL